MAAAAGAWANCWAGDHSDVRLFGGTSPLPVMCALLVPLAVTTVGPVRPVTQLTGGTVPQTPQTDAATDAVEVPAEEEALVEESLVEEVSIDGMCGVY